MVHPDFLLANVGIVFLVALIAVPLALSLRLGAWLALASTVFALILTADWRKYGMLESRLILGVLILYYCARLLGKLGPRMTSLRDLTGKQGP